MTAKKRKEREKNGGDRDITVLILCELKMKLVSEQMVISAGVIDIDSGVIQKFAKHSGLLIFFLD